MLDYIQLLDGGYPNLGVNSHQLEICPGDLVRMSPERLQKSGATHVHLVKNLLGIVVEVLVSKKNCFRVMWSLPDNPQQSIEHFTALNVVEKLL